MDFSNLWRILQENSGAALGGFFVLIATLVAKFLDYRSQRLQVDQQGNESQLEDREVFQKTLLEQNHVIWEQLSQVQETVRSQQQTINEQATKILDLTAHVSALEKQLGEVRAKYEAEKANLAASERRIRRYREVTQSLFTQMRACREDCPALQTLVTESMTLTTEASDPE